MEKTGDSAEAKGYLTTNIFSEGPIFTVVTKRYFIPFPWFQQPGCGRLFTHRVSYQEVLLHIVACSFISVPISCTLLKRAFQSVLAPCTNKISPSFPLKGFCFEPPVKKQLIKAPWRNDGLGALGSVPALSSKAGRRVLLIPHGTQHTSLPLQTHEVHAALAPLTQSHPTRCFNQSIPIFLFPPH